MCIRDRCCEHLNRAVILEAAAAALYRLPPVSYTHLMAVGVIIGGAFSKIVSSLVNDVIMPLLGLLTGQVRFSDLTWTLRTAVTADDGTVLSEAITLGYGQFLQNVLDFLLVSSCIFFAVRIFAKPVSYTHLDVYKRQA